MKIDGKSWRSAAAALACALALGGCVTIGRPFDRTKVPAIVINKTKQADILGEFGQPFRTGLEDGDLTWTYLHYRLGLGTGQTTSDLYLRFNSDGTVKSYAYNTNESADTPSR